MSAYDRLLSDYDRLLSDYGRLLELLRLPPRWNGGNAPRPSTQAVEKAADALGAAALLMPGAPIRIAPDADGGVAMYFFGGGRSDDGGWWRQAGLLIDNDGCVTLYLRDRRRDGATCEVIDASGLRGALDRICVFVTGP